MKYILNNDNLEVVGKQYLNGVGNYTGNTTNALDLATVINDMPIIKGNAENSAVLKGGNNQVISESGVALGSNNVVGLKGFYYKHIRFVSSTLANIYLSETQVIPTITTGGEIKDKTIIPANYLAKGDIISIVNDNKYNDIAEINNMSEGMIQIKWLSGAPFASIKKETNLSPEDYSIYCLSKPTQGISDLGKYSFANGTDNKAINTYTEVSGKGNIAKGKFAKVWGKDNVGGYNTTTFGTNNVNLADNSLVNGTNNINEGSNSVIHGNKNKNYGKRAFIVGNENITNNENEAAFGKYNNSENDTRFSIGIGTSDTDRKNAFEVKQNGDIYVKGVEGRIQDKLDKLVNITYLELKSLRDSSKLVPGQQYRITDYVTTTAQENTQIAEEYHQFDIIVIADDVNVLNENARAIQHEGDTFLSNSDLNAWELRYCLDNDTNRFAWADDTNGKGVIYYMKDEWNNECPYDFKNIQFARWELSNPVGYRNDFDEDNEENKWVEETTLFDSLKTGFYGLNYLNRVFYYGYNENYDYDRYKVEYTISASPTYCYTFGKDTDYSISGGNYGNIIKEYKTNNKIQLNNIVFLGINCSHNSFGNYCYNNSFGYSCSYNSLGINCNSNSLGNYCSSNSFGNDCNSNSLGNYCSSNSFGNDCNSNSFGNSCYYNGFGKDCFYNGFGYSCSYNSLGNNCYDNSFSDYCNYNSFGNDCYSNSFDNGCYSNSFGNDCYYNSFGEDCISNSFGISCYYNGFGYSCSYNSLGDSCSSNSLGDSCSYNSLGNNCSYNSLGYNCYDNSFGNNCRSNSFGNYCRSNSFGNKCRFNSFRLSQDLTNNKASGDKMECVKNVHYGDGCENIVLYVNPDIVGTIHELNSIRNINVAQGLVSKINEGDSPTFVELTTTCQDYEIKVARNSAGDIKVFCLADLIA